MDVVCASDMWKEVYQIIDMVGGLLWMQRAMHVRIEYYGLLHHRRNAHRRTGIYSGEAS